MTHISSRIVRWGLILPRIALATFIGGGWSFGRLLGVIAESPLFEVSTAKQATEQGQHDAGEGSPCRGGSAAGQHGV